LWPSDQLNTALTKGEVADSQAERRRVPSARSIATLVRHAERTAADVVFGDCVFVEGRLERLLPQHRFRAKVLREYGCFLASNAVLICRSVVGDARGRR
jgi:hypothetical protein